MNQADIRLAQDQLITDCEERESQLTEWETTFIDSIRGQFEAGRFLSSKQEATLQKIWDAVTKKQAGTDA